MNFIKKQSVGFYLTTLTVIIATIGLIFYIINCNTNYFKNTGISIGIVACIVVAVILEIIVIFASQKIGVKGYLDIGMIIAPMLLIIAFAIFVSLRVNSIASILSFERNAQTMADLSSAIIGMGFCFASVILSIVSAFFDIVRE